MKLSIGYFTARKEPEINWFVESLCSQLKPSDTIEIIVVDSNATHKSIKEWGVIVPTKPNIWSGEHKITKDNWWTVCQSRNTFLSMAKFPFIAMVDDRCVLAPTWLQAIRDAEIGKYVMAGSYEKRHEMKVQCGKIIDWGKADTSDSRSPNGQDHRFKMTTGKLVTCGGSWLFGCCLAMPLEWALKVNGYPESCDAVSHEDCVFGLLLENNGYPIKYDYRAKIIEDRTPGKIGEPIKRSSKERFSHDEQDKTHSILKWARTATKSNNDYNILTLRSLIKSGGSFPIPEKKQYSDWFDGQDISTFGTVGIGNNKEHPTWI